MNFPHDPNRPASAAVKKAVEEGNIEELLRVMSVRQKRFCEEYVIDFNGAAAVVRAGYSPNYADRQGSNLLKKNVGIQYYVDYLTRSKAANTTIVNPDYIIAQITSIIGKEGAKDGDKLRGLELLARHLGMFIERTELTGKDGGPLEMRETQDDADALSRSIAGLVERGRAAGVDEGTKH